MLKKLSNQEDIRVTTGFLNSEFKYLKTSLELHFYGIINTIKVLIFNLITYIILNSIFIYKSTSWNNINLLNFVKIKIISVSFIKFKMIILEL